MDSILKPYPVYKPSGVEWLGDVPEHWEVGPVKRAFSSMDYGISESASDSVHDSPSHYGSI